MKLFVGLGNPGGQYARHRHNVGYVALEKIASEHSLGPWRKRFQGETTGGTLGGERVVLLKPTTYMNDSGRSVGDAARFLKIDVGDIYVFHDEIDLAAATPATTGCAPSPPTWATSTTACASASGIQA
jgi:PTH1 family peptidyl-tRNA hydrolase